MTDWIPVGVAVLAAAATIAAGLLPMLGREISERRLHLFLGATAGLLLAVAFVDLIPEALEGGHAVGWTIALGFLGLYAIEWAVGIHGHGQPDQEHGNAHLHRHAPRLPAIAFVALSIHRAVDGLTMPAAFELGETVGLTAGAAVLAHQIPDGLAATSLFLAGGWSRPRILRALAILGLLTPAGALLGLAFVGVPGWLPHLLALAAVTFIFIAAAELMPELHHGPHKRVVAVGLVIGYAIAFAIERLAGH